MQKTALTSILGSVLFGVGYVGSMQLTYRAMEDALGRSDTETANSILYNIGKLGLLSNDELYQLGYDAGDIALIRSFASKYGEKGVVDPQVTMDAAKAYYQAGNYQKYMSTLNDLVSKGHISQSQYVSAMDAVPVTEQYGYEEDDPFLEGNLRKQELDIALKEQALLPKSDPYLAGNLELQRLNIERLRQQLNSEPDPLERRRLQLQITQMEQQIRYNEAAYQKLVEVPKKYSAWDDFDDSTKEY